MALALLLGPANAGKVARLLDRYLESIDRSPFLVVPTGADVEPVEHDLLARSPVLLGGRIGTFDDLFEHVLERCGERAPPVLGEAARALVVGSIARGARLDGLEPSARFPGFADALADALADLETGLVEPAEVGGDLGRLYEAYRGELSRLGVIDRAARRRRAAELVASDLRAWDGAPVLAYGFEDLTGAEWQLLEALAARAEVSVSLPYEPGRSAFESLRRTVDDLAALAAGRVEELPAQNTYDAPALAYLERALFEERHGVPAPALDGAVRFLEAAGPRAAFELAGEEILGLLRAGVPAEEIAVVAPSLERVRAPLDAAFAELGIPYALEGRLALGRTQLGRAVLGLLRFAWLGGGRGDLFAFLRSPYSGLDRRRVDFVEGRLRGRAVADPARVEEETLRLLGHGIPALDAVRAGESPLETAREALAQALRGAFGLEAPPTAEDARLDLRGHAAALSALDDLARLAELGGSVGREAVVGTLDRAAVRLAQPREPGRVAVLDLLRARTRRFTAVFVVGLEEGSLPGRSHESPFLTDERREELETGRRGRRLRRPNRVARDRYLFYTACTRSRRFLYLVRESSTEDGRPREPSPFWDEVRSVFEPGDVARWTRRRRLSEFTRPLDRAPTERERLRAAAALAAEDEAAARALARANGWERRIDRALAAFTRPTRLVNPHVLEPLASRDRFSVTDLEQFVSCSSMWLFTREIDPRSIDAEVDPRLRGQVAHQALHRFYAGLPRQLGVDRPDADTLEAALAFLRDCLAEAIRSQVRIELSELELLELEESLAQDLEHFVRQEVALGLPLVPRRFEVAFGSDRAPTELQRGLDLGGFVVSGKIDRIDADPGMAARGIVQDYKSGAAFSAATIDNERKLQIPLYVLALRDLVGIEPLGGLYRSLSGARESRGLLRAEARGDALPGLKAADYLEEEEFWGTVDRAVGHAREAVARIREGDVGHDPRGGRCPDWCDLWSMCRVARP
jgi:ATP-dependent helicase/DNAse subunit B